MVKDFNPKLVFAACVGFGPYIEMKPRYEEIAGVKGKDPRLSLLEWVLFEFEEPWIVEDCRRDLAAKFHISNPLRLYAKYLANLPTVRRTILSYYERLLNMGLAVRIKLHTAKGEYFGDAISTSLEVVELVLKRVFERGLPSDEELKALNKTALIWHLSKRGYRVGEDRFLALLASHGITVGELKEELDALNKRKLTSKYIDRMGERPFIVIDEDRFREYVLRGLEEVETTRVGIGA